eukprot:gene44119-44058_t
MSERVPNGRPPAEGGSGWACAGPAADAAAADPTVFHG